MRTTRPFSTISYHEEPFLINYLNGLILSNEIDFWCYIRHFPEEDEGKEEGKKFHIHLLIYPNGQFDTDRLKDCKQYIEGERLPRAFLPVRSTRFDDWYLYNKHDIGYLASKLQTRKYHYDLKDFEASDKSYLKELTHLIDKSKYFKSQQFIELLQEGYSIEELASNGYIPIQQIQQYMTLAKLIINNGLERNGDKTHD